MPDYADEYADAVVRYAATQHYVTLRLKEGRTVRRLVSTNRSADDLRAHYRQQGHFPLTIEPATDAHRKMFEKAAKPPTEMRPVKTVDWTPGTAPPPTPKPPVAQPVQPPTAKLAAGQPGLRGLKAIPLHNGIPVAMPVTTSADKLLGLTKSLKSKLLRGLGPQPPKMKQPPAAPPRTPDIRHNPDLDAFFAEHQPFEVTVEGQNGPATVVLHAADEKEARTAGKALGGKVTSVRRRQGPPPPQMRQPPSH